MEYWLSFSIAVPDSTDDKWIDSGRKWFVRASAIQGFYEVEGSKVVSVVETGNGATFVWAKTETIYSALGMGKEGEVR